MARLIGKKNQIKRETRYVRVPCRSTLGIRGTCIRLAFLSLSLSLFILACHSPTLYRYARTHPQHPCTCICTTFVRISPCSNDPFLLQQPSHGSQEEPETSRRSGCFLTGLLGACFGSYSQRATGINHTLFRSANKIIIYCLLAFTLPRALRHV